jgi:uncharacterized protein (DUF1015 family)
MDAALYSLIGVIAGVTVTQLSNYFLESKKSKNAYNLKKLELEFSQKNNDKQLKRDAYSEYLNNIDLLDADDFSTLGNLTTAFYKAMIIADNSTQTGIIALFNMRKSENRGEGLNTKEFLKAKRVLLKLMHNEINS